MSKTRSSSGTASSSTERVSSRSVPTATFTDRLGSNGRAELAAAVLALLSLH